MLVLQNETLPFQFHSVLITFRILLEQLQLTIVIFGGLVKMVDIAVNSVVDQVCHILLQKNEVTQYFSMLYQGVVIVEEK